MEDNELRKLHNALVDDVREIARDKSIAAGRSAAMMWFVEALIRTHPDRAALSAALDGVRPFYEQPFPDGVEAHDEFLFFAAAIRQRCELQT